MVKMRPFFAQKGFTLVELMVVIIIVGILVAVTLPNLVGATDRARVASVRGNQHVVQELVEQVQIDLGSYPVYLQDFTQAQDNHDKLYKLRNPYYGGNGTSGVPAGYTENLSHLVAGAPDTALGGRIVMSATTLSEFQFARDTGANQSRYFGSVYYFAMGPGHTWAGSSTWDPNAPKSQVVGYGLLALDGSGHMIRGSLQTQGETIP